MNIQNVSFKGATININAFSDTHGELALANNALEELRYRQKDVFCTQEKGTANVTAICGDWFMDGAKKGFVTNPNKQNGLFQLEMFNEFTRNLKRFVPNNITLLTAGNHEFDGGVPLLAEIFSKIDAEIIMSNLDFDNSPAFKDANVINKKILELDDDKNPELKHKVLFLGVSPVNLVSYQSDLGGVSMIDNVDKSQAFVEKDDYTNTLEHCKKEITDFKEKNPNGIVILMSHTGVKFADNLAKEAPVNLVFDGHEHKDTIRIVNDTPIIPLSQNFKKIVNAKINIDDNGKVVSTKFRTLNPLNCRFKGPLSKLYARLFKNDLEKIYSLTVDNPNVKSLDISGIRQHNNYLANFVTDSILEELRKKDASIDFFALNSSAIRHGLEISKDKSISPLDISNVLVGLKEEDGQIMITEVTGETLASLILDNVEFNKINSEKNPLIQYSGLIIDKSSILEAKKQGASTRELTQYITNANTGKKINPNKVYKIANVEKYFNKSQNREIRGLKEYSQYTGFSAHELFREHFENSNGRLHIKCDIRVK